MPDRRRLALALLLACLPLVAADGEEKPPAACALEAALARMNIQGADLGYRPQGHWARYPHPNTVPYVLPFFESLLAHPLDTYEFTRTLGNAVEDFLTPERLRVAPEMGGKETLHKLGIMLATERRIGGFRVFGIDTAHLDQHPAEREPLADALGRLGGGAGAIESADVVPAPLRKPLAKLVLDVIDARQWIDRGLRRIDEATRAALWEGYWNLGETTPAGSAYLEAIDDIARLVDEHSLWYGNLKALQALQDARRAIGALERPAGGWPDFEVRAQSPWGAVSIAAGTRPVEPVRDPLLVVRIGGPTQIRGPLGATAPGRPLSLALLLDTTGAVGAPEGTDLAERGQEVDALARGVLGCGILYVAGTGDHAYRASRWGLGAGLFGLGCLVDEGGDDVYEMRAMGQGAGYFGAGLLLDAAGADKYVLREGDGQGLGGPGGIGVLGDRSGDDFYYAEPLASKAGRADYHSEGKIAVSNAQGVGSGRRGDLSDGHVWAGGLGVLIDVEGDDLYRAGNFSQGLGYWYGTGLLWDGGGDDQYRSVYFTQGSGAHFAIGALIDEGGDDVHLLEENGGAGLAFGWDVVNAFLIDRGAGRDHYEADRISLGVAEVRSNAFFVDEGGEDVYVVRDHGRFLGAVDERDRYLEPGRTSAFTMKLGQVGMFLDLGGTDRYMRRDGDGRADVDEVAGDGRTWNLRRAPPGARHGPNVSIGWDTTEHDLGFLRPWPRRGARR